MNRPQLKKAVKEIAFEETPIGQKWAWDRLTDYPPRDVLEPEFTSRFWGYVYGLAYGIARTSNPSKSHEAVASMALDAALEVFKDDSLHGLDFIRAAEAGKAVFEEAV